MSTNVFNKLTAEVGDINIGISVDSMGSGDPNIGRRTAQAFAKMYPKINVRYRRYVDAATAASNGSVSNSIQTIQTGTIAQTLTVWNGCMPGNTLAYQTANYDSIFPTSVLLDVMMIITGHTNGMATDAEMITTIQNYITLTRTKSPNSDIWISTENAQTTPIADASRIRHYERQLAIRAFAGETYAYIPILEAFDERESEWPSLIQTDGIHPTNGETGGYELWSKTIEKFLVEIAPEILPPVPPSTGFAEYVANLWKSGKEGGTPITAEWMNHIEKGIKESNFLLNMTQIIAFGPGIDMSGVTDSSVALQKMVLEAQRTGKKLIIPPGVIKGSVITDMTVTQPVIEAAGNANGTMWIGMGLGKPCITMRGVSGAQSFGRLRNIRFSNPKGTCVELQGTIGVFMEDCEFHSAELGVLFHNLKGTNGAYAGYEGDYTEFCQILGSTFRQGCKMQIEYRRTGGHASFHGTGFRNTIFNQTSQAWGRTNIVVGAGCTVYNAPWDGMFFIGNPGKPPIVNNSGTPVRVNGNITVEARPGVVQTIVNGGSNSPVFLAGHLNRLSSGVGGVKTGTRFYLVEDVTYFGNSSTLVSHHKKPYEYQQSLVNGPNIIYETGIDKVPAQIIAVNITGSNYNHHALLYVTRSSDGSNGDVKVLSAGYVYDSAALGACAFTMSDGNLQISKNTMPTGAVVYMKIANQHSNRSKPLV